MNEATANQESDSKPLKPAAAQEFLRARSSRKENRDIVRDLLRGVGVETITAAATKSGIAAALSGFDDNPNRFDPDPNRYSDAFSRLLGPAAERASRPASGLEWQASVDLELPARPSVG
ncbi:MAG TPA: hypothetical protein VGS22_15575 [Thermoanaerobaculia bacterium]|nr:hypothetical protein [Thermoanaerobaculia bacterium]